MRSSCLGIIIKRCLALSISVTALSFGIVGCSGFLSDNTQTSATETADTTDTETKKETKDEASAVFTAKYYLDENTDEPSDKTTEVVYGTETKLYTASELGFSKEGQVFKGWKIYRESDNKWYVKNTKENKNTWIEQVDGKLPEGYEYNIRKDGGTLVKAAKSGIVRLYGVWEKG